MQKERQINSRKKVKKRLGKSWFLSKVLLILRLHLAIQTMANNMSMQQTNSLSELDKISEDINDKAFSIVTVDTQVFKLTRAIFIFIRLLQKHTQVSPFLLYPGLLSIIICLDNRECTGLELALAELGIRDKGEA